MLTPRRAAAERRLALPRATMHAPWQPAAAAARSRRRGARFVLGLGVSLVGLGLGLGGCAGTPRPDFSQPTEGWPAHQRKLLHLDSWKLKGKIGIKAGGITSGGNTAGGNTAGANTTGGDTAGKVKASKQGGSANLRWDYRQNAQAIELYGPLGGGRVEITADANGAVLKDTKGRVIYGATLNAVLYERLGWHVPFDQLVYWSRGIPEPGAADIVLDAAGRLKSLQQGDWIVEYQDYHRTTVWLKGQATLLELPRTLNLRARPQRLEIYTDDGEYLGDQLTVKVILKRWSEVHSNGEPG